MEQQRHHSAHTGGGMLTTAGLNLPEGFGTDVTGGGGRRTSNSYIDRHRLGAGGSGPMIDGPITTLKTEGLSRRWDVSDIAKGRVVNRASTGGLPPGVASTAHISDGGILGDVKNGISDLKLPRIEDFDVMANDLRRTYQIYLQNARNMMNNAQANVAAERQRLTNEKEQLHREIKELRISEMQTIQDARQRAEEDIMRLSKQIESEREAARAAMAEERKSAEKELTLARRTIQLERGRLKREQESLDRERRRIADANTATQTQVEFNVGGVIFQTSRNLLTSRNPDSYLAALFSGRYEVDRDRAGRIFIDRDAAAFRHILNFLRDPQNIPRPEDDTESMNVYREASHYGIKFYDAPMGIVTGGHDGMSYLDTVEYLSAPAGRWSSLASMETARAYHGSCALDQKVYAIGGQNLEYKALCDVEVYDSLRNQWTSGPSLSTPRKSCGIGSCNGRIFVVGGFGGTDILSSVEAYDSRTRCWTEMSPLPAPRSAVAVVPFGNSLLAAGGSCGERTRTALLYEPRMDKWIPLGRDLLQVRSGAAGVSLDSELVMILGGIDQAQQVQNSTEVYEGVTKTWCYHQPLLEPRVDAAAALLGELVVVAGGQAYGEVLSSVEYYHREQDQWQRGAEMIQARFGHGCVALHV